MGIINSGCLLFGATETISYCFKLAYLLSLFSVQFGERRATYFFDTMPMDFFSWIPS